MKLTDHYEHDSESPWLSRAHAETLAAVEPEPLPEPTDSHALKVGPTGLDRIRRAICRESGKAGQRAAEQVIRSEIGSQEQLRQVRTLQAVEREGAA